MARVEKAGAAETTPRWRGERLSQAFFYSLMLIDLQKITTRDGIVLRGGVIWPKKRGVRQPADAIVLLHGLCGNAYAWFERVEPLIAACRKERIAVASFNTRGSSTVQLLSRVAPKQVRGAKRTLRGGGAFEKFDDCAHDIRAMIDFLSRHGYRRIVLIGHSTGANKAAYYCAKTKDRRVKKLVLLGPISDPAVELREQGKALYRNLAKARQYVQQGKGDALVHSAFEHLIMTPKRYLSLYTPGSREDVFPYYDPKGNWRTVESIRIPILVVLGDYDQYLDRDAEEVMEAFQKHTRNFRGTIIVGADHGFNKRGKQLARAVISFMRI